MHDPDQDSFTTRPEHALRRVHKPMFSGLDAVAFVVTLVMVCMPLALGALAR